MFEIKLIYQDDGYTLLQIKEKNSYKNSIHIKHSGTHKHGEGEKVVVSRI